MTQPAEIWTPPPGLRFLLPLAQRERVVVEVARSFGHRALASGIGYLLSIGVLVVGIPELGQLGGLLWVCSGVIVVSQLARGVVSYWLVRSTSSNLTSLYWMFLLLTYAGALGWGLLVAGAMFTLGLGVPAVLALLVAGVICAGSLGTLSQSSLIHAGFTFAILGPVFLVALEQFLGGASGRYGTLSMLILVEATFVLVQGARLRREFVAGVLSKVQLTDAHQQAEQRALARGRFLAIMSHELRTPLNGVLGSAQLFERTTLNPEQQELLVTLRTSGEVLQNTIANVLDFSKLEAGELVLDRHPVNLGSLAAQVVRSMGPAARRKDLDLQLKLDPQLPLLMKTDGARVSQILLNLIGNAVKFTSEGSISVHIVRQGARVRVDVKDTGIGIRPEVQDQIFAPFTQAERSTNRQHGGTGLGLSISRSLAQELGGTLTVQSSYGSGATFCFELPLDLDFTSASTDESRIEETRSDQQIRVMIVDDSSVNRWVAERMVVTMGHVVVSVASGEEAVEHLRNSQVDLVLMDCEMPVLDGAATTRLIRDLEGEMGSEHIPIIALTAHVSVEDQVRCKQAGMDDFLSKPIKLEALEALIASWTP